MFDRPMHFPLIAALILTLCVQAEAAEGWKSGEYVYDGAGNIVQIGTASSPNHEGKQNLFLYDGARRLTQATIGRLEGDRIETYQYDAFGNLQKRFVNGGEIGIGATSMTTNRMEMRTYDEAGNVTGVAGDAFTHYAYDPLNRMVEKDWDSLSSELYVHTPGDERIGAAQTAGSVTQWTWTIRDFEGKPLRQFSSDHSGWTWLEDDVWRADQLAGAERAAASGGRRHFHLDHLGSARLVTGARGELISRHDYSPFGLELTSIQQEHARGSSREEPLKFTGHERDYLPVPGENALYLDYMHARYYSAAVGRFSSVDPTWESARLEIPQAWNRYSYVMNNPIMYTDPDGRVFKCQTITKTDGSTEQICSEEISVDAQDPKITPWNLGWEWLTGNGPRHRQFNDNDDMTQLLKRHNHVQKVAQDVCSGVLKPSGRAGNDLSGFKGVPKYLKDYTTLLTAGQTGNLAATYLGSYGLRYSLSEGVVNMTVTNGSSLPSALRPPVVGYTRPWQTYVDPMLNSWRASGPMSETTQTFNFSVPCH